MLLNPTPTTLIPAIKPSRRLPIGAEPQAAGGTAFRVWAPQRAMAKVLLENESERQTFDLMPEAGGYFSAQIDAAATGMRYWIQLEGEDEPLPDPASRFQPAGSAGPSVIIDPGEYKWRDGAWAGISLPGQVFYELHVGTFTQDGTWKAAINRLPDLAAIGVTAIELMPVAEFPGSFGWSYDGANLFAPSHCYGAPDDFRRFVDTAHAAGVGVILDVVFNHFGSAGEKLIRPFAEAYFSRSHKNEWGSAVNFDGEDCEPVREFVLANLRMWIGEYHLDGVRIDATQAFCDDSPRHILLDLAREARAAAGDRRIIVAAESEPQKASLMRPASAGGCEIDGVWSDDFHHTAMVRLTGRSEAYYSDYSGSSEEFLAAAKWGYLYQGQRYDWQKAPRGGPALDLPAAAFIHYLQNHDQLANSVRGQRLHELTSPGRYRAMTALWLLMPQTPLLFQGQEFASPAPFLYFNDSPPDEASTVKEGRGKFMSQFRSAALPEIQRRLADPAAKETFSACKLDWDRRDEGRYAETLALHRDLLQLRAALRPQESQPLEGSTLGPDALLLRYHLHGAQTRLLIVNFGIDRRLASIAQPLVAPPAGCRWVLEWSSEDPRYGGNGAAEPETSEGWRIPGEAAVLLKPAMRDSPKENRT